MQQLDTNQIFAKNIIFLRTKNNMTQLELAEKLNYSDKAVSRWERAEAIPDAKVLIEMSDIFGVSIDNLLKKEIKVNSPQKKGVCLIFNAVQGKTLSRFFIVSLLVWSILVAIYLTAVYFGVFGWWPLLLLGLPAQIIVALSFRIK